MSKGGSQFQRVDITDKYDPRVEGRAAQKGTLFRYIPDVGDPILMMKADDGFSTDWRPIAEQPFPITVVVAAAPADVDVSSAPAAIDTVALVADDLVLLPNQ